MQARKLLLAAALLAACKDDPTGPSGTPKRISISAPFTVLTVGGTLQLTATVYDALNKKIPNATVAWESLTPSVASVSSTGLVTGLTVGEATIVAVSGALTSTVELTVDPDPCVTPIVLNVGDSRVLSGPAAVECITLAPINEPSDLLFVTANVAQQLDQLGSYQVSVPPDLQLGAPMMAGTADLRLLTEQAALRYADHIEAGIRDKERELLRLVKPAARAARLRGAETAMTVAPANAVGDLLTFRVPDLHASNLCTTFTEVQGRVKVISQRAVIVEDVARPAGGFTDADYAAIAAEFDNLIYHTDTLYFGRETDRNNDQRITILYTPEVNKATAAGEIGFIAGFFWGGDLVLPNEYQAAGVTCPQTNGQEIFYLMVPDPEGTINNNKRTIDVVLPNTRGTIAHELQHMINQGVRLFDPAVDSTETAWLNEALSHMAEELVGRAVRGFGDFQTLTYDDVNPTPGQQEDYDAFFR
ncbi:MAG TPA: Ig-like domain-containing protein, partial [Gemmatimonadaceae bacterium]